MKPLSDPPSPSISREDDKPLDRLLNQFAAAYVGGGDPHYANCRAAIHAYITQAVEAEREDTLLLRREWWLTHCIASNHVPYGDDGEMDCNTCMIDFRREPVREIIRRLHNRALEQLALAQQSPPSTPAGNPE